MKFDLEKLFEQSKKFYGDIPDSKNIEYLYAVHKVL